MGWVTLRWEAFRQPPVELTTETCPDLIKGALVVGSMSGHCDSDCAYVFPT